MALGVQLHCTRICEYKFAFLLHEMSSLLLAKYRSESHRRHFLKGALAKAYDDD